MKILICHNDYQQRGGESDVVEKEIELLRKSGISVIEYRVNSNEINSYSWIKKVFFFINTVFNISSYYRMSRLVFENSPDIVHIHNVFPLLSPSIYYACFKHKIPVVQTIHNFRFFCPNGLFFTHGETCERCSKGNFLHSIRLKCYRGSYLLTALYAFTIWLHRKFDLLAKISVFIVLTEFAKQKLLSLGIKERQIVIKPNFLLGPSEPGSKGDYGIYLGRLSKEKGIITLLNALEPLCERQIYFKFAGRGELEGMVVNFVKNHSSKTEYLGYAAGEEKSKLLRNAKYVVVSSECYENMPTVVLEAFKYGKPVIASRIGSLPYIVEHGKTGLLFTPGNSNELAEAIEKLELDNELLKKMSESASDVFRTQYSFEKQIERFITIYSNLTNKA